MRGRWFDSGVGASTGYDRYGFCLGGGWMGEPSLISSVARRRTKSPACKLPETSMRSPSGVPFVMLTHSARPLRSRTTKVRSVVVTTLVLGTNKDGCDCRTGHFTEGYMPGESEPSGLKTSNSTAMVRVFGSRACEMRATVPEYVRPG